MAAHLNRRSATALGLLALIAGGAVAIALWPRARAPEVQAAESIVTHLPEAWPPAAGDLESEIAASTYALQRIAATYDSGVPAGELGSPIAVGDEDIPGMSVRRLSFEGMPYLEVVLGQAEFDEELPMVVVLHGRGGSAQLPGGPFMGLSRPVRVIVPQATDRLGSGWQWIPVSVGSGLVDRLSSSLFGTAQRLARFIRHVRSERPTYGRPIVTGFSQGGLLTYTLALHHDDVVGYAFPLSTWLPPPLEPLYKRDDLGFPPIRAMHGTSDPVIPIAPTRDLVSRLSELGFAVEFVEFEGAVHSMTEDMNALFHLWLEQALCAIYADADCPAGSEGGAEGAVIVGAIEGPTLPFQCADAQASSVVLNTVENSGSLRVVSREPGPVSTVGAGAAFQVVSRADVNGDHQSDLIVRPTDEGEPICSAYGECMHALLVACAADRYALMWGPDYGLELAFTSTTTTVDGVRWRDVVNDLRRVTPRATPEVVPEGEAATATAEPQPSEEPAPDQRDTVLWWRAASGGYVAARVGAWEQSDLCAHHRAEGAFEVARTHCETGLATIAVPEVRAALYYDLGRIEEQAGRIEEARVAYLASLEARPRDRTVQAALEALNAAPGPEVAPQ